MNKTEEVHFEEPISLSYISKMIVKQATVFWKFRNILRGDNDTITSDGTNITLTEGNWNLDQITTFLKNYNIEVKYNENNPTFKLLPT
jgi:hypothetical protein